MKRRDFWISVILSVMIAIAVFIICIQVMQIYRLTKVNKLPYTRHIAINSDAAPAAAAQQNIPAETREISNTPYDTISETTTDIVSSVSDSNIEDHYEKTVKTLIDAETRYETSKNKEEWANPEFIEAIKSGDVESVENFIKSGVDVNAKKEYGKTHGYSYTPLILAIETKNEQIVKILLDAGADANAKIKHYGSVSRTALTTAVKSGNSNVVAMLLDAGADINVVMDSYDTFSNDDFSGARTPALIEAILSGNEKILKMLIIAGADLNIKGFDYLCHSYEDGGEGRDEDGECYAIEFAIDHADEKTMKTFIESSTDIKQKTELISYGIYIAAKTNDTKKVKTLIDMGNGLNLNKSEMNSALLKAAGNGNEKTVKMLLDAGADHIGKALVYAARFDSSENKEVIKTLLKAGANINEIVDDPGLYKLNAYIQAIIQGHYRTAKMLADNGADTNINANASKPDLAGALIVAVQSKSEQGVEKLLKAGANANFENDDTAWWYRDNGSHLVLAVKSNNEKIVKMLLDAGADVNPSLNCMTPLVEAIKSGNEKIFHMIVDAGADLNQNNPYETSLLDIAIEAGNKNIENFLREKIERAEVKK